MRISVIDPISPAIERTKLVLFQPFDLGKWFKLGFCAFLVLQRNGLILAELGGLVKLTALEI